MNIQTLLILRSETLDIQPVEETYSYVEHYRKYCTVYNTVGL